MVLTHGIAYDTGAFPVRPVIPDPQLMHVIQNPSLHRFQAVSCIRQSPCNDDAHGIINEGFLHDVRILGFNDLFFHISVTMPFPKPDGAGIR